jgi:hypothetical protein
LSAVAKCHDLSFDAIAVAKLRGEREGL